MVQRTDTAACSVRFCCCACDVGRELFLQLGMDAIHVFSAIEAERDTALIRDYEDAQAGPVEFPDRFCSTGQQMVMLPGAHVFAFRQLAVQDSVAVKEDGMEGRRAE